MDQQPKTQLIDRIKTATNVLVTVSANPSVDQLAGCIGLTLLLNKMGKHATAVFSGQVPDTIEFLQPEKTLETTTDSLRDFIISLDKSKADKLRYKVEDAVVKIFITPYRNKISEEDLEFGQGDFNVDVVVALGVHKREDLDQAITAHGRILHDATVISLNNMAGPDLGTINWVNAASSSLCEMLVDIAQTLAPDGLDSQMATALLTGIVAETERFSNEKAHPQTMTLAGKLMAAGASSQLVVSKLEGRPHEEVAIADMPKDELPEVQEAPVEENQPSSQTPSDGAVDIDHNETTTQEAETQEEAEPEPSETEDAQVVYDRPEEEKAISEISIDDQGKLHEVAEPQQVPAEEVSNDMVTEPPQNSGALNSASQPEQLEPSTDPLSQPVQEPSLLSRFNTDYEPKIDVAKASEATDENAFPDTYVPENQPPNLEPTPASAPASAAPLPDPMSIIAATSSTVDEPSVPPPETPVPANDLPTYEPVANTLPPAPAMPPEPSASVMPSSPPPPVPPPLMPTPLTPYDANQQNTPPAPPI